MLITKYLVKALQHWPNLFRLAEPSSLSTLKSPSKLKRSSATKFQSDNKPGVFTQSKPHLEKDREIVKRILKGVQLRRPAEVQTALLRRYFLELTQVKCMMVRSEVTRWNGDNIWKCKARIKGLILTISTMCANLLSVDLPFSLIFLVLGTNNKK